MYQGTFASEPRTVDAVVRNLEIIGEAASRIPDAFKARYPQIPSRRVVGLRNRNIHEYFGVHIEIVWSVVSQGLPDLPTGIGGIADSGKEDITSYCTTDPERRAHGSVVPQYLVHPSSRLVRRSALHLRRRAPI
jgi:uncharacterized protein with HEPN domain